MIPCKNYQIVDSKKILFVIRDISLISSLMELLDWPRLHSFVMGPRRFFKLTFRDFVLKQQQIEDEIIFRVFCGF